MEHRVGGEGMGSDNVERRIDSFMRRKEAKFPDLAASGRNESRTIKYARELRASGQLLIDH
jgi:hypothetical protein